MNKMKRIERHYSKLTGFERASLAIEAMHRDAYNELDKLRRTDPKKTIMSASPDYLDRMEGIELCVHRFLIEFLKLSYRAQYRKLVSLGLHVASGAMGHGFVKGLNTAWFVAMEEPLPVAKEHLEDFELLGEWPEECNAEKIDRLLADDIATLKAMVEGFKQACHEIGISFNSAFVFYSSGKDLVECLLRDLDTKRIPEGKPDGQPDDWKQIFLGFVNHDFENITLECEKGD